MAKIAALFLFAALAAGVLAVNPNPTDIKTAADAWAKAKEQERFQQLRVKWEGHFDRGEGTLKPGDPASDFDLKIKGSEQSVRLSSFQGEKAVALVFGSFT